MNEFNVGDVVLYQNHFYSQKCIVKIIEKIQNSILHFRVKILFVYYVKEFCDYEKDLIICVEYENLSKIDLLKLCQERQELDNIICGIAYDK